MINLLSFSAEDIVGIISGITAGVVAIVGAVAALINNGRKHNCDNPKCCVTGRNLKPKQKKESKKKD